MTQIERDTRQQRKAILQRRCIKRYAKKLFPKKWKARIAESFDRWVKSGNAERFNDNFDKGEE